MQTTKQFLSVLILLAVPSWATTYTVKAGGGGNYTTIQACASAIGYGDTCTVYAGTYNENVSIPSGTWSSGYKTFQVNGSDLVYVYNFTQTSHTKVIGFHIQTATGTGTPCVSIPVGTTDYYTTDNVMFQCGGLKEGWENFSRINTYGYILRNTISYPCGTATSSPPNVCAGMAIFGDHHLVENNDISHVADGVSLSGRYNVFRNNAFHDAYETECGSNSGNCHIDFIESEPNVAVSGLPSAYNVYEGNTEVKNTGSNNHGFLVQADLGCSTCTNTLIRFNAFAHVSAGTVLDDNAHGSAPGYSHVKVYNNTMADTVINGRTSGEDHSYSYGSTYPADKNNIFYYIGSATDFNPVSTDGSTGSTFSGGNNLAWCTAGSGSCQLRSSSYGSGAWLSDAKMPNNKLQDPLFVGYSATGLGDLRLQSGSPARGAGGPLTTTNGSGSSSTTLIVADADYFQDGMTLTGVQPDWIRVGASTTVQVAAAGINYSTKTITLASPISWSNGDPVYLYKKSDGVQVLTGSAPDMGAYPYGGAAPIASLDNTSHDFGNWMLGVQSTGFVFNLQNTGSAVLTISSITPSGDFAYTTNCPLSPGTLGIGSSCTITATFTPTQLGGRSGSIAIADDAAGSPQTISLSGTGVSASPSGRSLGTGVSAGRVIIQ